MKKNILALGTALSLLLSCVIAWNWMTHRSTEQQALLHLDAVPPVSISSSSSSGELLQRSREEASIQSHASIADEPITVSVDKELATQVQDRGKMNPDLHWYSHRRELLYKQRMGAERALAKGNLAAMSSLAASSLSVILDRQGRFEVIQPRTGDFAGPVRGSNHATSDPPVRFTNNGRSYSFSIDEFPEYDRLSALGRRIGEARVDDFAVEIEVIRAWADEALALLE